METRNNKEDVLNLKCKEMESFPNLTTHLTKRVVDMSYNQISRIEKKFIPPNVIKIILHRNKIKNVHAEQIPDTVLSLKLSSNELRLFNGIDFIGLTTINLSNCKLTDFIFPPNVVKANLNNNELRDLPDFPPKLIKIKLSDNLLYKLPVCNDALEVIELSANQFTKVPILNDSIKKADLSNNTITQIRYIPSSIEWLDISYNSIAEIAIMLPAGLIYFNISKNGICEMPELPTNLQVADFSHNRINTIVDIPESMKKIDISDNYISHIPDHLFQRDNLDIHYGDNFMNENYNLLDDDMYESGIYGKQQSDDGDHDYDADYETNHDISKLFPKVSNQSSELPPAYSEFDNYQHGNTFGELFIKPSRRRRNKLTMDEIKSLLQNPKAVPSNPHYVSIKNTEIIEV